MSQDKKIKNTKANLFIFGILASLSIVGVIITLVLSFKAGGALNKQEVDKKEEERPANLEVIIIKDSDCKECYSLDELVQNIKKQKVIFTKEETLNYQDETAKSLISKYKINKLPALIINGEVEKTDELKKIWANLGVVIDGTFVLKISGYPYKEVDSGKVRGLVKISLIDDKSCKDCYDVKEHLPPLSNFGFQTEKAVIVDKTSSDGRALIQKYNITKIPTIVLSGDVKAFVGFDEIWKQVGTIEKDGAYIFRDGLDRMNVSYMDLKANKVKKAEVNKTNN